MRNDNTNNYVAVEDGGMYTIGEYDDGYNAYITNDGIFGRKYWGTQAEAQEAAELYNEFGEMSGIASGQVSSVTEAELEDWGDDGGIGLYSGLGRLYDAFGLIDRD